MNKIISSASIICIIILSACAPKSGGKMAESKNSGKAPSIQLPTGEVRKNAPKPGNAPEIHIGKAETFTLGNGLKVIVVENHKLPKVSFQIFVDSDPVLENDAVGYVEIMGDLLSKGTTTRSKSKIDEEVDFIGANLSTTSRGVSGGCLTKHSEKLLEIMSDCLLNPNFPEEELKKTKTRMQSSLAQKKDNADAIAGNVGAVLRNSKYHPLGEIMTEETLAKVSLDKIKNHYSAYFKPNVSYLVIVGDITKAKAEKYANKFFGKWQMGEVPKHNYPQPKMPEKTQVDFVHKPGAVQSVVSITYPVSFAPGEPDAIRARLMNAILGGYFNSRVNANLREGHAYTYGATTSLSPHRLVGSFRASASVRNAVTDSSIIQFLYELNRLRDEKVPKKELQLVKNVLSGQFAMNLEKPETIAEFALNMARYNLAPDYYENYLKTLNAVSDAEIQAMAKKFVRPDRAHILVVGNKEEVAERLKQFSPEGKVNFYDFKGNPVKTEGKIPAGMTAEKIIEDYIAAIGGAEKVAAIKSVEAKLTIKTGGPEFNLKTWQSANKKYAMEMAMNGQIMSKRVFDGSQAKEIGMGGATRMLEGEDLEEIKERTLIVKELKYKELGYKLNLKTIEPIDGKNAYAVEVTKPNGKTSMAYFDMATSLKIKELSVEENAGEQMTITTDYDNYKDVNGVLMPHLMMMGGIFPVPVKTEVVELKINAAIEEAVFDIK